MLNKYHFIIIKNYQKLDSFTKALACTLFSAERILGASLEKAACGQPALHMHSGSSTESRAIYPTFVMMTYSFQKDQQNRLPVWIVIFLLFWSLISGKLFSQILFLLPHTILIFCFSMSYIPYPNLSLDLVCCCMHNTEEKGL